MPATRNFWYFGTRPIGVISPCGEVTRRVSLTVAPMEVARSLPMTMGGIPAVSGTVCGVRSAIDPWLTDCNRSPIRSSSAGMMPLMSAPPERAPRGDENLAVETGGDGLHVRNSGEALHQGSPVVDAVPGDAEQFDVGGRAPTRRSCRSRRIPLVMASATMSAATPAATPMTEIAVTRPTTACLRRARR